MSKHLAERLDALVAMRQLRSLRALCKQSGVSYRTLHRQVTEARPVPVESLDRIAFACGVGLSFFSKQRSITRFSASDTADLEVRAAEKIANDAITDATDVDTMTVLNWLRRTGGRVEELERLRGAVDLFHPMDATDGVPRPYSIGRQSLARKRLSIIDEEHYTHIVSKLNQSLLQNVRSAHLRVHEQPYSIADVTLDDRVDGKRIYETYCRFVAPVSVKGVGTLTLVHADPVPVAVPIRAKAAPR